MSTLLKGCGVLLLGAAVFGIWGVSAFANYAHALQLAGASEWRLILAGASAASDVLKAGAALAIIASCRRGIWTATIAAAMIWVACTAWSVRSGVGFVATTIADTKVEAKLKSSTERSLQSEIDALPAQIAALRAQIVTAGSSNARVSLQQEIEQAQGRLDDLRHRVDTRAPAAAVDPVGALLSRHFQIDEHVTELLTVLLFLALVELGSNLGLVAFSSLLRWPPQVWGPEPELRARIEPPAETVRQDPPVRAVGGPPRLVVDNTAPPTPEANLADFIAALIEARGPNGTIQATLLHTQYGDWCRYRELPAINAYSLQAHLRRLGVVRRVDKSVNQHIYVLPAKVVEVA